LGEGGALVLDPSDSPVGFLLDARNYNVSENEIVDIKSGLTSLNGIEKVCALSLLLDICVDQKGIRLRMDVFHHNLETVEATSFGNLYFTTEALNKVLVDNSVGCSKERKDVGNEVSLVVVESIIPVVKVLG
jgi:hypothetical protein